MAGCAPEQSGVSEYSKDGSAAVSTYTPKIDRMGKKLKNKTHMLDLSLQSRREKHGPNQLPLNIGHRGFKKRYPENTMTAFKGAIAAGADVLETDLHLSRDGVVVISHVRTLSHLCQLSI